MQRDSFRHRPISPAAVHEFPDVHTLHLVRMTPEWLLGTWRMLHADASLDFAPGVRMEFLEGGDLLYHIDVGGTDRIVELRYRVDNDTLHTENPLAPHSMSVRIRHGDGDVLVLDFVGAQAILVRETPTFQ